MVRRAKQAALAVTLLLLLVFQVAAAPTKAIRAVEHGQLLGILKLQGQLFHVQGVDLDEQHIWVTSADTWNHRGYLHEFDRATGKFMRRLELTDGARYHPGGFSISGHSIWVPVAEYRPDSSAVIEEIDADSLQVRRKIHVADHLGCVAVGNGNLVAGNWDSKRLYIFDQADGRPMRVVRNPSKTRYQDMKFIDGKLVAGGLLTGQSGAIDWIAYPSMRLLRSLRTGATEPTRLFSEARPYTGEGMTLRGRDLYVLPEDGPSRLFHFRLDADTNPANANPANASLANAGPGGAGPDWAGHRTHLALAR